MSRILKGSFTMIKEYFERYKKFLGCIIFPPASAKELISVNKYLQQNGFSEIPDEYKEFLKLTDGTAYNGIEFFGTQSHPRKNKNYTFPDLIASNLHYDEYDFFKSKIIIGRISENILFYDKISNSYAIADRLTLRSRREVASFEELFKIFLDISCP